VTGDLRPESSRPGRRPSRRVVAPEGRSVAPTLLSITAARRMALAAQGLDRPHRPHVRVGRAHLRAVLQRLGIVQIDSVNVLAPAHYQVPYARLGPYDRRLLDELVYGRREFVEQWAHEASILPVEHWKLLRHRMVEHDRRLRSLEAFMDRHDGHARRVLEAVRRRGPLTAADVPEPDGSRGRTRGWWGWSISKATFEGLLARGTLAVAGRRRVGFARVYDLSERVVPDAHRRASLREEEARLEMLRRSARALGIGTAADLADYYRMPIVAARRGIARLVAMGDLIVTRVEGWREPAYRHPAAKVPRAVRAATLLSPFDPLVWYRPRVARLFGFEYRIEIYTPKAKRRWGYYVLPFLLGDRLVARVDLKADRTARRLRVAAAHLEAGAEEMRVAAALAAELTTMAGWLGLESVTVGRRGNLAPALATAVRSARRASGRRRGFSSPA
jgi:uncharacterized protein